MKPSATPNSERKALSDKLIAAVASDPQPGDKVRNRSALDHQTRTVTDRTLGGDVHYIYNLQMRWRATCTLSDWKVFCECGRVTASRRKKT